MANKEYWLGGKEHARKPEKQFKLSINMNKEKGHCFSLYKNTDTKTMNFIPQIRDVHAFNSSIHLRNGRKNI